MTRTTMSALLIGFVTILVAGTNIVEANDKDLFQAAASGDLRMVRFFLEIGADVNAKNKDGKTAPMVALERGYLEVVKLLHDGTWSYYPRAVVLLLFGLFLRIPSATMTCSTCVLGHYVARTRIQS